MNTFQFLDNLKRYLSQKDLGALSSADVATIVQAINQATTDWWDAAPHSASNIQFGIRLPGSKQVTVTTETGSRSFTSDTALTADDVGRAIVIAGDEIKNTLTSTTSLMLPAGITGDALATVYGNAFALPAGFQELTGSVWVESPAFGITRWPVVRMNHDDMYFLDPIPAFSSTPRPVYYSIRPWQTFGGVPPFQLMQFYPMPSAGVRISFSYTGLPAPWTSTDFAEVRELGFEDRMWFALVDVVVWYLANTGLLREGIDLKRVDTMKDKAMDTIRRTPAHFAVAGTIGTPKGF
jgi:hypothetical protein